MMKNIAAVFELEWPVPRHHEIFAGIQDYAREHHAEDWALGPDNFPHAVISGELPGAPYDGVIGRLSPALQDALDDLEVPAVNVWVASSRHGVAPTVIPDLAACGQLAIDHFVARGIRRVAHVGVRGDVAARIEGEAFKAAAREAGLPCTIHKCYNEVERDIERWRVFCGQVNGWLERWESPIGVLAHYDDVCRHISSLAIRAGWKIPEDLCLLGTGNNPIICQSVEPTLSSIQHSYRRIGYEAAKTLDGLMHGEPAPQKAVEIPPIEVAMRRSTDVFAVPDPLVAAALRYMADNCAGPMRVDMVAQTVNAGRRTLERRFRKVLGRSITHELNRLRIERMKRLLVETDDPVKVLVGEAGFGSPEQMRLVFREFTGRRPMEFREQHRASRSGGYNQ
jgi:LacI family transcriptional regulator